MTIQGENITLTRHELNSIVEDAVLKALQKIAPQSIASTDEGDHPTRQIKQRSFTPEEYEEAMRVMAANRGKGDEPKVGIFWYDVASNELFGVVSHKVSDYSKPNAGGGLVTCSEMHEDVWKKAFNKQKYHGGIGPFTGAYQDKPRGRVFYDPKSDRFTIAIGSWFTTHQEAYDLIMEEFDLPEGRTDITYGEHWNIGQTWR